MKASLIIIGNEILSGRTQDKNLSYLANWLNEIGIQLTEVRVIRDEEDVIVETVNHLRKTYDYVFTTGGIGPTHDDITSESIAKAFSVDLEKQRFFSEDGFFDETFEINEYNKTCLINGFDNIDYLLNIKDKILNLKKLNHEKNCCFRR